MIEFKGVVKQYLYGKRVLNALDLKINQGEIVCVLGVVGSGKTTFLKVLAGATDCEGQVLIDGVKVGENRDDIVMMFDDLTVFKSKTIFYNLAYSLQIRKLSKQEILTRVNYVAEKLSLMSVLYSPAFKVSDYDLRRMAIARLFLRDNKILVLDQATSALKVEETQELWNELAPMLLEKRDSGSTIVFSSSNVDECLSIADRIAVFHNGQLKQFASYDEIMANPKSVWAIEQLEKDYNFFKVKLIDDDSNLKIVWKIGDNELIFDANVLKGKFSKAFIGKDVLLGLMPDDFIFGNTSKMVGINEDIQLSIRSKLGYLHTTKNGLKVRCQTKLDTIFIVPDLTKAVLYDVQNENSIMLL